MDRSLKWILLVSLLINAALVGFMSAQFFRGPRMFMMNTMPMPDRPKWPDDETRSKMDKAFEAERPALDAALKETVAARAKAVALLRADTLDTAALEKEMAAIRAANDKATASFQRAITAAAQNLPAVERANLARMLDREPRMFDRDFKVFNRDVRLFMRGPNGPGPGLMPGGPIPGGPMTMPLPPGPLPDGAAPAPPPPQ